MKAERKYLVHFIDANPLGDPATAVTDSTNYVRLGKDLEEYTENLNPSVETKKNIWGETSVIHSGYEVSSDVDPYLIELNAAESTSNPDVPEVLGEKLMDIANNRRTGAGCQTTKVDILIDIGGDTSGISVPFTIHNNGGRVKGNFDLKTKTFTVPTTVDLNK